MKWSKTKLTAISGAATLLITAVLFAGPYKEKAGFIFNWFIDGVKYMELDTTGLKADNISDLAGTGSPDFQNGLNIDDEPTLVAEYMTATTATGSPIAGKFYSSIIGREPMLDLSKIPSGKHRKCSTQQPTNLPASCSVTLILKKGDIIRTHHASATLLTGSGRGQFRITQIVKH